MPAAVRRGDTPRVITNVIIHLMNELPIMVDVDELPSGADRSVRCTNVRTVDGKRPSYVHDRNSTFVFPLDMVRLIEAPPQAGLQAAPRPISPQAAAAQPASGALVALAEQPDEALDEAPDEASLDFDEEPDEDLLARIRSV